MTTEKAKELIALEKMAEDETLEINLSENPLKVRIPLISLNKDHFFYFDLSRKNGVRFKMNYQNRYQNKLILVRIDIGKTLSHTNPDGKIITGSHIHYHDEIYFDKIASPLPTGILSDISDLRLSIVDFMRLINVNPIPVINYKEDDHQQRLF
ncbi:MAG: DUF6978 family protein [Bacteroidota bacterium]